ncbi:MAG TPA: DUF402 domain-containing protein [Polyangia bacterium]|nr:DUF402 domain-containing protein [Polyangia bacterium]
MKASVASLPPVLEVKRTLFGTEKRFDCHELARDDHHLAVLWIAPAAMRVHGIDLPAGTVSIGHFWRDRHYNVYHWLDQHASTVGWYFNIADETSWTTDRLTWRDLVVDVLATPAGRLDVLDEDELPAVLDDDARAHLRAGLRSILDAPAAALAEVEAASRALVPLIPFAFGAAP